jgi:hypothetical protein
MVMEPREALSRSSRFRLTPGNPGQIRLDTTFTDSPNRLHTEGIYTLSGDALTYCVAAPDRPRPTEFTTVKGDGNTLVTLKRFRPVPLDDFLSPAEPVGQ